MKKLNTYAVWWDTIFYGHFQAKTEEEARLMAAGGDEDEAETLQSMQID